MFIFGCLNCVPKLCELGSLSNELTGKKIVRLAQPIEFFLRLSYRLSFSISPRHLMPSLLCGDDPLSYSR